MIGFVIATITLCYALILPVHGVTEQVLDVNNLGVPPYDPAAGEMQDMELRVLVEPGKMECFYQDAKQDHNLEIGYQVVETTSKFNIAPASKEDLVIDFILRSPAGQELKELRQNEGNHLEYVKQAGVSGCFFNFISSRIKSLMHLILLCVGVFDLF